MNTNRIIVDLGKVSYASFGWECRALGIRRDTKPKKPSVNGQDVSDNKDVAPEVQLPTGEVWPRETLLARAKRRGLLDRWEPCLSLQLCNSHSLTYTGAKAVSIWKEWNKRIFKRESKQHAKTKNKT